MYFSIQSLIVRIHVYMHDLYTQSFMELYRVTVADVGEINAVAVDWVSKHVYWTDARRHSVEVSEFDGSNRRVLSIDDLDAPRGIVADPNAG